MLLSYLKKVRSNPIQHFTKFRADFTILFLSAHTPQTQYLNYFTRPMTATLHSLHSGTFTPRSCSEAISWFFQSHQAQPHSQAFNSRKCICILQLWDIPQVRPVHTFVAYFLTTISNYSPLYSPLTFPNRSHVHLFLPRASHVGLSYA